MPGVSHEGDLGFLRAYAGTMSSFLLGLTVVGLIGSGVAVYLWRRQPEWWHGWRDWLEYAPLFVLAYLFGVVHGLLRNWLGTRLTLASLVVVMALVVVGVIWNEPHLLPPGVRMQRHPSHP